jgi:hypothetical protein
MGLAMLFVVLSSYRGCFLFHAFVCETPAVLLEALLRGAAGFTLAAALALLAALLLLAATVGGGAGGRRRRWANQRFHGSSQSSSSSDGSGAAAESAAAPGAAAWAAASACFRDGALCFAAALTLAALPCCLACGVYRDFRPDPEDEDEDGGEAADNEANDGEAAGGTAGGGGRGWSLRALPTLLGSVDPRRFAAVSVCGQGADAANANLPLPASDAATRSGAVPGTAAARAADANGSLDGAAGGSGGGCCGCVDIRGPVLLPPRNLDRGLPPAAAWLARLLLSLCDAADDPEAAAAAARGAADGRGGYSAELARSEASDSDEEAGDAEDSDDRRAPRGAVELTTTGI